MGSHFKATLHAEGEAIGDVCHEPAGVSCTKVTSVGSADRRSEVVRCACAKAAE